MRVKELNWLERNSRYEYSKTFFIYEAVVKIPEYSIAWDIVIFSAIKYWLDVIYDAI